LRYATQYRLDLAVNHVSVTRAGAEAGLRNFAFASSLVRQVTVAAANSGDPYVATNARALEARISCLAGRQVPIIDRSMASVSTHGAYGEYLASVALAAASRGERKLAKSLRIEALETSNTIECRGLAGWTSVIVEARDEHSRARDLAHVAFDESWETGAVDPLVWAYRACPAILGLLMSNDANESRLSEVLTCAEDRTLAKQWSINLPDQIDAGILSRREREVYDLMAQGLSNRAIAQRLYISESTAKVHVRHILEKLRASSRTEAVAKWRDIIESSLS
jgi:DNA-binding CsgD family transcriptional regulator